MKKNLKLVVSVEKRYINMGITGVEFLDLIQEGNIGLMKAIDRFDVTKGYKFSSYAMWWIRQFITRYISNFSKSIRIPVYQIENLKKLKKSIDALENRTGKNYNIKELNISKYKINQLLVYDQNIKSLNSKINDDEETELIEFLISDEERYEDIIENQMITREIIGYLKDKLDERSVYVILSRFGFLWISKNIR